MGAMSLNALRYRRYLDDARRRADGSADPAEKEAWLRMAARWLRLLALAEQSPLKVVPSATNRDVGRLIRD